ncbi:TRAP transporter permease [Salibacterium salarium]|uniref:TRAP transporter permease n=1 Tax=Salibacterium salarium TaxID=284579 RepID=A0A3R9QU50_9BACI|nr:TRAP transporter permease [Salibacterium salarium]RSL33520.1 TRAP transporter permease [Salibacterium salarium]
MAEKNVQNNRSNETSDIKGEQDQEYTSLKRDLTGWNRYLFMIIAVIGALYHLYILNFNPIDPWLFRSSHLVFGCILGFMLFSGWKSKNNSIHWIDWIFILATITVGYYIFANIDQLQFRFGVSPTSTDCIIATIGLVVVFELTRRASGWMLPILAFFFVAYVFAGPYLPGMLNHSGYSFDRFVTYIYGLDGVFGVTLDVSSKYIVLFIIFGAFLQISRVGQYFIDLSFAVAGGLRGGPAKVAIISSGLMGMMNGTSAGNAVATGSLTIPLMRKNGYNGRFAAATEATASAGGQLLPPIMGAGAFLMAEIIGIPYNEIIIAAIVPAILYFISVYFMVDFEAQKKNMKGIKRENLPKLKSIVVDSYLFIPIVLLIILLLNGYSIIFAGTAGIVTCFLISLPKKATRMGIKSILEALELGMKNSVQLIAVVACAGVIVGVIALTGVGMRFSSMLLSIAENNLLLALVFAMFISILLGMGMPTTAAYAVAASVVAPGLIQIGIEPLLAHMFVFYYAVVSAITPPVALAAYAAAGIAGTNPMKTGVQAFRLGIAAFIVPFMFFFSPQLLLQGDAIGGTILAIVTACFGIYLLASAVQAWFFKTALQWYGRIILLAGSIMLILSGILTDIVALALVMLAVMIQKVTKPDIKSSMNNKVSKNVSIK